MGVRSMHPGSARASLTLPRRGITQFTKTSGPSSLSGSPLRKNLPIAAFASFSVQKLVSYRECGHSLVKAPTLCQWILETRVLAVGSS